MSCASTEELEERLTAVDEVLGQAAQVERWGAYDLKVSWVDGPSEQSAALILEDVLEDETAEGEVRGVQLVRLLSPQTIVALLLAAQADAAVGELVERARAGVARITRAAGGDEVRAIEVGLVLPETRREIVGSLTRAWERACVVVCGEELATCDEVGAQIPLRAAELAAIACVLSGCSPARAALIEDIPLILNAIGVGAVSAAACLVEIE